MKKHLMVLGVCLGLVIGGGLISNIKVTENYVIKFHENDTVSHVTIIETKLGNWTLGEEEIITKTYKPVYN